MDKQRIIVIGAGASGMLAAGRAAEKGSAVLLLEKMEQPGKKILVSGKTRCNLTNSRDLDDFILAFGPNGRFLYPAFNRFFRDDLRDLLQKYGLDTKEERGGRIFAATDDARDVVKALSAYLVDNGVQLFTGTAVKSIDCRGGKAMGVVTDKDYFTAGAVILAAGGSSWPVTGSTGDGYQIAAALGHNIVRLRPALVPLVVQDPTLARSMQGVILKNVRLTAYRSRPEEIDGLRAWKNIIDTQMGEMIFTHFGIGGPIVLRMSLDIVDAIAEGPVSVAVDLKPALKTDQLILRLQRDFDNLGKRSFQNILRELLPQQMIEPVVKLSGIPAGKPGHQINAGERDRLAALVKSLRFQIKKALPLSAAMVTAGGISLAEINPRTMASKLYRGLYFCREVMDIDADTGGYNLQAAFSTGYAAGESAAEFVRQS